MRNSKNIITLDEFTIQSLREFPQATGELSGLMRDIGLAAKKINVEVNKAGLVDILGETGLINVQGEKVKRLDVFADKQYREILQRGVRCAGYASEECEDYIAFDDEVSRKAKYVCVFDPLDGSSNIDVNVSVGSIFGIYKRLSPIGSNVDVGDFLQPGNKLVAAGYVIFGSSTMLVYATRRGVNGFTLDPSIGEFCLSHPLMKCPNWGNVISINYHLLRNNTGLFGQIKSLEKTMENVSYRYTGSMVADLHRNLLKGGIFIYPSCREFPGGKLRLQYECNPFAFIIETAGGKAINGAKDVLDIIPTQLHDRVPFYAGSIKMVGFFTQTYL